MRRIRSKALWKYLTDSGALATGDEAIIQAAKAAYRKQYKRNWRKQRPIPKKELRPAFTEKNYQLLLYRAKLNGFKNPTSYIVEIALSIIQERPIIPHKDILLEVLQKISMSHLAIDSLKFHSSIYSQLHEIEKYLKEAENTLNKYLNIL